MIEIKYLSVHKLKSSDIALLKDNICNDLLLKCYAYWLLPYRKVVMMYDGTNCIVALLRNGRRNHLIDVGFTDGEVCSKLKHVLRYTPYQLKGACWFRKPRYSPKDNCIYNHQYSLDSEVLQFIICNFKLVMVHHNDACYYIKEV